MAAVAPREGLRRPIEVENDDDSIDEDQVVEYREYVELLGDFPDKVKINSLSMIAGDYAESRSSAGSVYEIIRKRMLTTTRDNLLPLVYVLDSILKNVKGFYIDLVQEDAVNWMPAVHHKLQDGQRAKLKKVWKTWEEFKIFSTEAWKEMGRCFNSSVGTTGASSSSVAGIPRTKDGSLLLSAPMRTEMQNILDEIQNDGDELEKVSLERIADINPDLLANIKSAAEENLQGRTQASGQMDLRESSVREMPTFFVEIRSTNTMERSKAWGDLKWDHRARTHDIISKLQNGIRHGTSTDSRYSALDALQATHLLAAASVTSSLLTDALQDLKDQEDRKHQTKTVAFPGAVNLGMAGSGAFLVDKKNFTNDGIKTKNPAIIGLLYEIGLPFLCSSDGQRFRTEIELSNHLDAIFKKNQLEKSMLKTEERGWYSYDMRWTGEAIDGEATATDMDTEQVDTSAGDGFDPANSTMPADEYRDRCVICGINFKMFFDNDDGIYKYENCREIEVLNDEAAEKDSENMLVHVTCWRGLGAPEVLTVDQTLAAEG